MNTPRTIRRPLAIHFGLAALVSLLLPHSSIGADEPSPAVSSPRDEPLTGSESSNAGDSSPGGGEAKAVLESFGLSRHQARWLTTEESQLRADLADLRRLERQYRQAPAALDRELRRANQLRAELVKARDEVDRLNQLLDGGGLTGQRYNSLVDEVNRRADFINQHVDLLASPLGAVIQPAVVKQAQALVEHYGQLSALLARSTQTLGELSDQYVDLSAKQAVRVALSEIGEDAQLGPAGDYRQQRRQLERLTESVWSDELPLAIVDNRPLLPVVLGERTFGVFALSREQGFSLISSKLAEAIGAKMDTSAPPSRLQAFGAGDYDLYPATIERIRLGRHTAENVPFMVLPPEAVEVTSVLDLELLFGLDVQLDLPKLTARVRDVQAVDKTALGAENR